MTTPRTRGPRSAADLLAELELDEDYQRRKTEFDAELAARTRILRAAEQPIVADLCAAGVEVGSVWDLINTAEPYPGALPVLLKHLQIGGYPDRVMESLGRAMAVKPAVYAWDTLRELYLDSGAPGEREGLAVALAASSTKDQLDALIQLLGEESRGDTRIHFLRRIKRLGGPEGRGLLESLTSHPVFGKEATALVQQPRRRTKKRPNRSMRSMNEGLDSA